MKYSNRGIHSLPSKVTLRHGVLDLIMIHLITEPDYHPSKVLMTHQSILVYRANGCTAQARDMRSTAAAAISGALLVHITAAFVASVW